MKLFESFQNRRRIFKNGEKRRFDKLLVLGEDSEVELGEQLRELFHLLFRRQNCRSEMPASGLKKTD